MTPRPLPGWARDLVVDGLRGETLTRAEVVKATRSVMLSACRAGWSWADVHALLTTTNGQRLPEQIATGRGGRPFPKKQTNALLLQHWQSITKVVAERPAWTPDDVAGFLDHVREHLVDADLSERQRVVMDVALDLAAKHGTSRPAIPVRTVVEALGGDPSRSRDLMRAKRALDSLTREGHWLSLAIAGKSQDTRKSCQPRRANLFSLAPALAETYRGANAPMSQAPPMSHPPMSHPTGVTVDGIHLTHEEIVAALGEAAYKKALSAAEGKPPRHLHLVEGEAR